MVDVGLGSGSRATWKPEGRELVPADGTGGVASQLGPWQPDGQTGGPPGAQWANLFQTASNAL